MKKFVASFMVLSAILTPAISQAYLAKSDDCKVVVEELAKGIANSYKQYGKSAKILNLSLDSATEVRDYYLDVDTGCVDTYHIRLSNDSAFKCIIEKIEPKEICG